MNDFDAAKKRLEEKHHELADIRLLLGEVERLKGELIKNRHDTATCVWMHQAARDLKRAEKAEAEVERLRARVEAVLKLHKESDSTFAGKPWCSMCKDAQNNHVDWPCATVRALEGK